MCWLSPIVITFIIKSSMTIDYWKNLIIVEKIANWKIELG